MKTKDISNKTTADLNRMISEKREDLRVFRFGSAGAKSKNVKEGMQIRKDIARIMTALSTQKNAANSAK